MPEDDPGTCSARRRREGRRVHLRRLLLEGRPRPGTSPARIELSRLTVRQYRNAVADLIGSFRGPAPWDDPPRACAASTSTSPRLPAERSGSSTGSTPRSQFDFGTDGPDAEKFDAARVLDPLGGLGPGPRDRATTSSSSAPTRRPALGQRPEPAADRRLGEVGQRHRVPRRRSSCSAAGRTRSGWSSRRPSRGWTTRRRRRTEAAAGEGVDRAARGSRRSGPPRSIPARNLSPARVARGVRRRRPPFPPDDRSVGYERGDVGLEGLGPGHDRRGARGRRLRRRPPRRRAGRRRRADGATRPRGRRLPRRSAARFAERAFRRPLTDEQKKRLRRPPVRGGRATRRRPSSGSCCWSSSRRGSSTARSAAAADAYDVAARLSFGLWDSLPDQALLDAAAAGKLATREEVAAAGRADARRPAGAGEAPRVPPPWLKVDQAPDLAKDPKRFPGFDAGDRLRPADLARPVPGRRGLGRGVRLPPAAAGRRRLPERPAGEVLRRRPAGRRRRSRR